MVEIVPFKPEHLAAMRLQAAQASAQHLMTVAHGNEIAAAGQGHTAMLEGQPIACAGFIQIWPGRAYAWAYLSDKARNHMRHIHRAVLRALRVGRWRRVEMAIDINHPAAKLWAAHLGFTFEGVMHKWTNDGRDVEMWART